jgi:hypothetical protein
VLGKLLRAEKKDAEFLREMSKKKLIDLLLLHIRNLWRVDGLYFTGIEEKFGTEAATEIDANCWKIIGKLEARELSERLHVKKEHMDVPSVLWVLRNTSWALYQVGKEAELLEDGTGIFRVNKCRTQESRIQKGLGEFPCKKVRYGYLKSFVEELSPDIEVNCRVCPPDAHPEQTWCEWEFKKKSA